MNKQERLSLRNQSQLYLEEERKKEREKRLAEEEKDVKQKPFILGIGSFIVALILSFMTNDSLTYFFCFSLFFIVASIISTFVVRSKLLPNAKSKLLIVPSFIYILGITLPLILVERGII